MADKRKEPKLKTDPRNARIHPPRNLEAVGKSLDELGAGRSIVVDRDGVVIGGNAVYEKAVELGIDMKVVHTKGDKLIVVVRDDLATNDPRRKALALADNQIALLAEWDMPLLEEITLEIEDIDLDVMGFDLPDEPIEEPVAPSELIDRAEELQKKWKVKSAQIWEIPGKAGIHRMMCGDSTDKGDVALLMDGVMANAVLTDPPYGQNQKGILMDEPEMLENNIKGAVKALPCEDAIVVAFQSPRTFPVWLDIVREEGHVFERMLWLDKVAQCAYPWRGWILKSEAILVSTIGEGQWQDVHPYQHDIYRLPEVSGELDDSLGWHGSVKPLAVVSDIIKRICLDRAIVFDGFLGSGTTVVAAEQEGRVCYGMEIAEKYVAVTLQRLTALGLEPHLVENS